jgi:hypothetical protein
MEMSNGYSRRAPVAPRRVNLPPFNAFTVKDRGEDQKGFWIKIGAAWPHERGEGYTLQLDAMPLDGKVVLIMPREDGA